MKGGARMPLYFTDKKKRWPPPKPVQYVLAALALLTAVGILLMWLRFFAPSSSTPDSDKSGTTTTSQTEQELPKDGYCLLIIEDIGYERFALMKFAPTSERITVQPISPDLSISPTETVAQMYQRTKAAQVVRALATHYQLPLEHFVPLSTAELEALISDLGGSLHMAPPEAISYRDENGITVRLPAEKNAMTPKQITAMLRYTQWKNEQSHLQLTTNLTVALLNHILTPTRDLNQLFNKLAEYTSVRVHHFNKFRDGLAHLAALNDGSLAQYGTVSAT